MRPMRREQCEGSSPHYDAVAVSAATLVLSVARGPRCTIVAEDSARDRADDLGVQHGSSSADRISSQSRSTNTTRSSSCLACFQAARQPRGDLFHLVLQVGDGIRIIDVWESKDAYEEFRETRVAPVLKEMGIVDLSHRQFFDVHNYFAARRP
jgi:hypothetical protein